MKRIQGDLIAAAVVAAAADAGKKPGSRDQTQETTNVVVAALETNSPLLNLLWRYLVVLVDDSHFLSQPMDD